MHTGKIIINDHWSDLYHFLINPIARVYLSISLVNHIRGTVFKLLYINISNDSPYFHCPDEERFYPFEILAFRTLKLQLFRVVVFAFNILSFL